MKRRYSIWGREHCSDHDVEIVQVDTNPQAALDGLLEKTLRVTQDGKKKKTKMRRYSWLRIVENVHE